MNSWHPAWPHAIFCSPLPQLDEPIDQEGGWKAKLRGSTRKPAAMDLPATALVVVATGDQELGNFFVRELGKLKSQIQVEIIRSVDEAAQCLDYFRQNGPNVNMVLVQPMLAQQFPNLLSTIKSYGTPAVLFSSSSEQRAMLGADDYISGPSFGQPFDSAVLGALISKHR